MKKKVFGVVATIVVLIAIFLIATGFRERTDVVLVDYTVSEDGSAINLEVQVSSSAGYVRTFKDDGGGVKPHYLKFYSTFGGLNSAFGAKNEFVLEVAETDTEIYFSRPDGGYEIVLVKADGTGEWIRPETGGITTGNGEPIAGGADMPNTENNISNKSEQTQQAVTDDES